MELLFRCSGQGIDPLFILFVRGGPFQTAYLVYLLGVILIHDHHELDYRNSHAAKNQK